jgi:hypothetical protein
VPLRRISEFAPYPTVNAFVDKHLTMQFGDVRDMLRLPLPDIDNLPENDPYRMTHGCNFAAAAILCNLISGVSVSLYQPAKPKVKRKGKWEWIGSGQAFKQLLTDFYPFAPGSNKAEGAKAVYDLFRNPAAHALHVHSKVTYTISISRVVQTNGLTVDQMKALENLEAGPPDLPKGLWRSGKIWVLVVESFYREILLMVRDLARSEGQMKAAEARFKKGNLIWTRSKA